MEGMNTVDYLPEMSGVEERIDRLVRKWAWVIGGVVDNDPRYVRAIIHDFLGVPIPKATFHTEDGMRDWDKDRYRRAEGLPPKVTDYQERREEYEKAWDEHN
jgi:hypothetical protein